MVIVSTQTCRVSGPGMPVAAPNECTTSSRTSANAELLSDATRVRRTAQKGECHVGFHGRRFTLVAIVSAHEGNDAGNGNEVHDAGYEK